MALFRSKIQSLSVNTVKNQGYCVNLLEKCSKFDAEFFTRKLKSFWSSREKPEAKSETKSYTKPTDNPLITKGCPSKCLEDLQKSSEEDVNKKEKVCKPKESFWTYIFGEETHESFPDPCTCRLAYKYKESCREEDPRLCDPRYTTTPGNVLLFTEFPKPLTSTSPEPQPQPPPLYKIPASVTCKRIADAVAAHTCVHFCLPSKGDDCKGECLEPQPYRLPYAEFRPVETPREPIICEGRKRPKIDEQPDIKEAFFSTKDMDSHAETSTKFPTCSSSTDDECFNDSCKDRKKLSRIERLKKLTAWKHGVYQPLR